LRNVELLSTVHTESYRSDDNKDFIPRRKSCNCSSNIITDPTQVEFLPRKIKLSGTMSKDQVLYRDDEIDENFEISRSRSLTAASIISRVTSRRKRSKKEQKKEHSCVESVDGSSVSCPLLDTEAHTFLLADSVVTPGKIKSVTDPIIYSQLYSEDGKENVGLCERTSPCSVMGPTFKGYDDVISDNGLFSAKDKRYINLENSCMFAAFRRKKTEFL